MSERKFGAGHAAAMARLGLKELRNMANPSRESVVDSEIGLYGTLTQGEIAEARGGPGQGSEQETPGGKLSLDDLRDEAQQRAKDNERGRDDGQQREQDRGLER